jgi:hypothetical protein
MNILDRLYQFNIDDIEIATDLLYDHLDQLLCRGEFTECDRILQEADVSRLSSSLMRSLLTVTYPARDQLPSRPGLYERVEQQLLEQRGEALTARLISRLK